MPFLDLLRYGVFAVFVASGLIALAAWAVRTRKVSPFSGAGRALRGITDPFVLPVERMLLRNGGNPQNAPGWIFGIAVIGGILVLVIATWITRQATMMGSVRSGRGLLRVVVYYAGQIVLLALLVRVIASWFGRFRYNKWLRPAYFLTDWFIVPLQKIIPPIGMIDLTPLIAWFVLRFLLGVIMSAL